MINRRTYIIDTSNYFMFFKRVLIRWKLRAICSGCGEKGKSLDDRNFLCSKHGAWDGSCEFVEAVNYEKNRHSVQRDLIGNEK